MGRFFSTDTLQLSRWSKKFLDSLKSFPTILIVPDSFKVSRKSKDFWGHSGKFQESYQRQCLQGDGISFLTVCKVSGQIDCFQTISKFPETLDVSEVGGQSVKYLHWLKLSSLENWFWSRRRECSMKHKHSLLTHNCLSVMHKYFSTRHKLLIMRQHYLWMRQKWKNQILVFPFLCKILINTFFSPYNFNKPIL